MSRARLLFLASFGLAVVAGTSAQAQTSHDAAPSTLDRAKLRIEKVCQRYDREMRYDLALKCYDEVAAMLTAPEPKKRAAKVDRPHRTVAAAPRAVVRPAPVAAAPLRESRAVACSSLLCSGFVVLGVGF